MSDPAWETVVIAGQLFAALTSPAVLPELKGIESLAIDHGILRIEMRDGRKFKMVVHPE